MAVKCEYPNCTRCDDAEPIAEAGTHGWLDLLDIVWSMKELRQALAIRDDRQVERLVGHVECLAGRLMGSEDGRTDVPVARHGVTV